MPPSLITLILLSIFWVILFILWMRFIIWDIKLNKINEQLYKQLSQAQEEIQRLQAKNSPALHIQRQPCSYHRHSSSDKSEEENASPSV